MKHSEYVESLKRAAIDTGKRLLIKKVAEKLPFLFLPILGPVTTFALEKIVEILIEQTEFAIFLKYTDMRVDREGREFSEAATENYKAQQSGNLERIAMAEKDLMDKFKNFVVIGSREG